MPVNMVIWLYYMKTTIELPDEVIKRAKATAAMRGESLRELMTVALTEHLERIPGERSGSRGWRLIFGLARREEVDSVDRVVSRDLETVDPAEWQ